MNHRLILASVTFLTGTAFGLLVANLPLASASPGAAQASPDEVTFIVSVTEVAQNFVFGEKFSGSYEKTLTMSDGSERSIVLTPMNRNGQLWVRFQDGAGHTYMGPNGWSMNGNLLVNLRNYDQIGPSAGQ